MALVVFCDSHFPKLKLTVGEDRAGTEMPCPKCGRTLRIPAAVGTVSQAPPPPVATPTPQSQTTEAAQPPAPQPVAAPARRRRPARPQRPNGVSPTIAVVVAFGLLMVCLAAGALYGLGAFRSPKQEEKAAAVPPQDSAGRPLAPAPSPSGASGFDPNDINRTMDWLIGEHESLRRSLPPGNEFAREQAYAVHRQRVNEAAAGKKVNWQVKVVSVDPEGNVQVAGLTARRSTGWGFGTSYHLSLHIHRESDLPVSSGPWLSVPVLDKAWVATLRSGDKVRLSGTVKSCYPSDPDLDGGSFSVCFESGVRVRP